MNIEHRSQNDEVICVLFDTLVMVHPTITQCDTMKILGKLYREEGAKIRKDIAPNCLTNELWVLGLSAAIAAMVLKEEWTNSR